MKWSTGQSGFAKTLRQVIKSTVANMNAQQQQKNLQATIHMKKKSHKTEIRKFQVSGFTNKLFHVSKQQKPQNINSLCTFHKKIMQTSCCANSAQTQQSLSSFASSHNISSDLTGSKTISQKPSHRTSL